MRIRSPSPSDAADRALRVSARRHIRSPIGKTLAFFSEREDENLELVRAHLLDLLDARPTQVRAQNLHSARMLLYKQADVFNQAFQAASTSRPREPTVATSSVQSEGENQ